MRKLFFCLLLFGIAIVFAEDGLRIAHVDSKIIFEGYKGTKMPKVNLIVKLLSGNNKRTCCKKSWRQLKNV